MTIHLNNEASGILHSAAKHLHATLRSSARYFRTWYYYHQSCYLKLKACSRCLETRIIEFCTHIKVKILWEKNAYLFNKLTEDVSNFITLCNLSMLQSHYTKFENSFKDRVFRSFGLLGNLVETFLTFIQKKKKK